MVNAKTMTLAHKLEKYPHIPHAAPIIGTGKRPSGLPEHALHTFMIQKTKVLYGKVSGLLNQLIGHCKGDRDLNRMQEKMHELLTLLDSALTDRIYSAAHETVTVCYKELTAYSCTN